jgi:HEPN domain-containing protein
VDRAGARADLAHAAGGLPPGGSYENLCFHAQQAAEKALKAVLLKLELPFTRTHSLQSLLDLFPGGTAFTFDAEDVAGLTAYAVATRYPGEAPAVTREECLAAIHVAERVVAWAEGQIA